MPQMGPFCFKNTTNLPVNDLLVVFNGTGGTLGRARITNGPPGRIRASGNHVALAWAPPLPPGGVICFSVWSRFRPILVYTALWTFDFNVVGPARQIPRIAA